MRTPAEHPFSSVSKGDIARRDIQQIDPKLLKHVQDAPDIGPARSELLRSVLAFGSQDDTVFTRSERLGQLELVPMSIQAGIGNQVFVHDRATKLRRTFRPGKDAVDRQGHAYSNHSHGS